MGEFAEGLFDMFHSLVTDKPSRLNKRMKEILLQMVKDTEENTYNMEDTQHELCMLSMTWLKSVLSGGNRKPHIKVGWWLCHWINDNQYHELCDEENFIKAMEWLSYKIRKHYSSYEMIQYMLDK
jgi:hypothetical protein